MSMFRFCDSLGYNTLQKYKKNPYLVIKKQIIYGISIFSAFGRVCFYPVFSIKQHSRLLGGGGSVMSVCDVFSCLR